MTVLDINELPLWSPWPERLLGMKPWNVPVRHTQKVDREYDKEKYLSCLDFFRTSDGVYSPQAVREFEQGLTSDEEICVAKRDQLLLMTSREASDTFDDWFARALSSDIGQSSSVIDLGCGYGYSLWFLRQRFPGKRYWGGEYSRNAVKLASLLFQNEPDITVRHFDFYDSTFHLPEKLEGPVLLFTVSATHQLPSAEPFIRALSKHEMDVRAVCQFEQVYELYDDSLMGLMRRRYCEMNDYNRDLLTLLRQESNIEITTIDANVFGSNPLAPLSFIRWQFRQP